MNPENTILTSGIVMLTTAFTILWFSHQFSQSKAWWFVWMVFQANIIYGTSYLFIGLAEKGIRFGDLHETELVVFALSILAFVISGLLLKQSRSPSDTSERLHYCLGAASFTIATLLFVYVKG